MAKYFSVKKNTNKTLTVSKSGYVTHTETINISADTTKNITLEQEFTPETITFNYTGAVQTYTIPSGCTKLIVDCVGAAGGKGIYDTGAATPSQITGAKGGRVQCTLTVTAGQTIYLYVGGKGEDAAANSYGSKAGGWNGGGKGYALFGQMGSINICMGGSGGGGASDIRIGGTALSNRKVVAGGAGGCFGQTSTYKYVGGLGGGTTGGTGNAYSGATSPRNATGGTQSAGGTGGGAKDIYAKNGSLGNGGNCWDGSSQSSTDSGSGGGGGYYGGGGNGNGAGGGGSSYTDSTLCSSVTHTQGYSSATGNGYIKITTSNS